MKFLFDFYRQIQQVAMAPKGWPAPEAPPDANSVDPNPKGVEIPVIPDPNPEGVEIPVTAATHKLAPPTPKAKAKLPQPVAPWRLLLKGYKATDENSKTGLFDDFMWCFCCAAVFFG